MFMCMCIYIYIYIYNIQADSIHFQACLQRIQDVELILAQTRYY